MGKIRVILITDLKGGIGSNNGLLYSFKKDLEFFKEKTLNSCCIMGRNTWDSLPKKLDDRTNFIVTSSLHMRGKMYYPTEKKPDGILYDTNDILRIAKKHDVWIIGGARMYNVMFKYADEVYHNVVHDEHDKCDVYVDDMDKIVADYFSKVEVTKTTDVDRISGNEYTIEFRKYSK